ncbi:MAG: homocysteine S-methyltransferase family protein [Atopobiaceae bacterium]|nr:homocysteine S-methyltransferase family protein [Atopobiaceae bacterium]
MHPISSRIQLPDREHLRVKDEHLQRVLDGDGYLIFDGAMGTMLQASGLKAGELPELLCLEEPEAITGIHRAYVDAGSQVATTNTFGANARKLGDAATVDEVFAAAIRCARESGARYVAADIGPTGALLEPMGTISFDEAYELFAEQARAGDAHGADLFIIETMTDLLEMKAAILAVRENSDLPVFATMTFDRTGRTFLGNDPTTCAIVLAGLGVQALGVNCSLGPDAIAPIALEMLAVSPVPVMVQANAGLPQIVEGETVYTVEPGEYIAALEPIIQGGASIIGGCCGTDPRYIRLISERIAAEKEPPKRTVERACVLTSPRRSFALRGRAIGVIGERINPTGKKRLKQALREGDYDYVLGEAISQAQAGADLLDVNAGLPEIDEPAVLSELVKRIQGVCDLPLQIDSSDPVAVEETVRIYAGKPLINSVNGKAESLEAILPIAKHYGCAVVGLTLDEEGIPDTAEGRFAIAERIVEAAEEQGIPRQDVYIDCLVMSASTNQREVTEILRAVSLVKERLGVRTVLGVSNVSFGLPARPLVNATFLAAAFGAGLDLPILNPLAKRYREVVDSWRVLCAQDEDAQDFIAGYAGWSDAAPKGAAADPAKAADKPVPVERTASGPASDASELQRLIVSGDRGAVPACVGAMLESVDAMEIINAHLIPALDEVGERFERGSFFLPQLMASAEAAKAGFDVIRERLGSSDEGKGPIVIATVKGDIHDIGKNIVRMLLENYGYKVYDLGRDVDPQRVVDAALEYGAPIVGLSALMTTTVKAMEETIRMLREQAPHVKVMVGGAVLTQEYADMIGADHYSKDAAGAARYVAETID